MINPTQRKNLKVYFWVDENTLHYIDSACQEKMLSRSAYLRWIVLNFNEGTVHQINEIHQELIVRGKLKELMK